MIPCITYNTAVSSYSVVRPTSPEGAAKMFRVPLVFDAAGDFVQDTAPEASPSFGCVARDTCPGDGLADPINNYMDYSPDSCMNTFTPVSDPKCLQFKP